jgi:hypothetical protein
MRSPTGSPDDRGADSGTRSGGVSRWAWATRRLPGESGCSSHPDQHGANGRSGPRFWALVKPTSSGPLSVSGAPQRIHAMTLWALRRAGKDGLPARGSGSLLPAGSTTGLHDARPNICRHRFTMRRLRSSSRLRTARHGSGDQPCGPRPARPARPARGGYRPPHQSTVGANAVISKPQPYCNAHRRCVAPIDRHHPVARWQLRGAPL